MNRGGEEPVATELRDTRINRMTVWGDFTCPWSHLAWRRTEALADDGVAIDWRTTEHDPWHQLSRTELSDRFQALQAEVAQVLTHLLPGEPLPYTLKGHVPFTGAATSAYAEAYAADVARPVRRRLFEAFWENGVDLDDARVEAAGAELREGARVVSIEDVGGELAVASRVGEGTRVRGSVPTDGPPLHERSVRAPTSVGLTNETA